jgi:hypothetical protein
VQGSKTENVILQCCTVINDDFTFFSNLNSIEKPNINIMVVDLVIVYLKINTFTFMYGSLEE